MAVTFFWKRKIQEGSTLDTEEQWKIKPEALLEVSCCYCSWGGAWFVAAVGIGRKQLPTFGGFQNQNAIFQLTCRPSVCWSDGLLKQL